MSYITQLSEPTIADCYLYHEGLSQYAVVEDISQMKEILQLVHVIEQEDT